MTRSSQDAVQTRPTDGTQAGYADEFADMTVRFSYEPSAGAGLMPGLVWEWVTQISPEERRQEALTMQGNCCRLYREEGLEFLLYGRMLKPLKLDLPQRLLTLGKHPDLAVPWSVWLADEPGRQSCVLGRGKLTTIRGYKQVSTPLNRARYVERIHRTKHIGLKQTHSSADDRGGQVQDRRRPNVCGECGLCPVVVDKCQGAFPAKPV